ncbi:MAG: hypothetical protein OXD45_12755 [Rhodobacteraceae bacterium]|nr:hypothetical protein [Paracoccaceae bacterium]
MNMLPFPENFIVVEGKDDEHVITHLLTKHNLQFPKIKNLEGYPNLRNSISSYIKETGRCNFGIVADANNDLQNRKKSIVNEIKKTNYFDISKDNWCSNSIFCDTKRNLRVGIWLMPDNNSQGELEDFIFDMIPPDDPILPRAKKYINDIPNCERKFKPNKITRAHVHAWLSTLEKPRPMGSAITANNLSHDSPFARAFVKWFCELFHQKQ